MKLLILIFSIFYGPHAFSEERFESRFRQAALLAVEELDHQKIDLVSSLTTTDLKRIIQGTTIIYDPNITWTFGSRRCASWQNPTENNLKVLRAIRFNHACVNYDQEQLKAIALHEILGVYLQADRNYEISAPLLSKSKLLSTSKSKLSGTSKPKVMRPQKGGNPFQSNELRGGSTGVGGGGDYDDLKFKILGLKKLDELSQTQDKFADFTLEDLAIALQYMSIKPASDITTDIEYRGPEVENDQSITYIKSSLYRSNQNEFLAGLAIQAAALELKHGQKPAFMNKLVTFESDEILVKVRYPPKRGQ